MKSITIRKVPEPVHRQLRVRAAKNGRSLEAELRAVLLKLAHFESGGAKAPTIKAIDARNADGEEAINLTERDALTDPDAAMRKVRSILREDVASGSNAA